MDKISKYLAVFLIFYALLGIGHLIFFPSSHDEDEGEVHVETASTTP